MKTIEEVFKPYPKTPRLSEVVIVTEKIDGTNASVLITEDGQIGAGSKNRIITPSDDNYGFAAWVQENREQLLKLGPGMHSGEWWGRGIQRGYELSERRFSLFNVGRWNTDNPPPPCCHVVPNLGTSVFSELEVSYCISKLAREGSVAAPGFMKPEGVIVYHIRSKRVSKAFCPGEG